MTKLSQCARCKKDRRNCGFYKQEDDTDCLQYVETRRNFILDDGDDMGCICRMVLIIVIFCICVIVNLSGSSVSVSSIVIAFFVGLFVLAGIVWLINKGTGWVSKLWNRTKSNKQMKMDKTKGLETSSTNADGSKEASTLSTRTLLQVVLHKLNLQYEFDDSQNFIVKYQGETFRVIAEDESAYLYIQDLHWYDAPLDDIDNLSLVYKAVNECNMRDMVRLVYTIDGAENELSLHVLYDILWLSQIPNMESYLQASFDKMLRAHLLFFRQMEELRREEFGRSN